MARDECQNAPRRICRLNDFDSRWFDDVNGPHVVGENTVASRDGNHVTFVEFVEVGKWCTEGTAVTCNRRVAKTSRKGGVREEPRSLLQCFVRDTGDDPVLDIDFFNRDLSDRITGVDAVCLDVVLIAGVVDVVVVATNCFSSSS
jgi:hypothetical protein